MITDAKPDECLCICLPDHAKNIEPFANANAGQIFDKSLNALVKYTWPKWAYAIADSWYAMT